MKSAYIYTRVSKKSQIDGEGLARQKSNTEQYIESLTDYKLAGYYIDEGISSYDKSNLKKKSALSQFLEDVDSNKIKEDSLLVLEAIDRLTRLPTHDAREEIVKILKKKINIGIAKWNVIIRHDNKVGELSSEILLTAGLFLAHSESEQKSQRIKSTIKIRQDRGREKGAQKRTQVCPAWLYLSEDRTEYLKDEEKSKVVDRIFKMKIYDRLGTQSIAKKLNELGIKPIGKTKIWGLTAVSNILKNIAVMGHFQPMSRNIDDDGRRIDTPYGDLIKDYYPQVISDDDFKAAQDIILKNTSVTSETLKGRTAGYKNLFRHLTYCYDCNSPMNFKGKYLACSSMHCNAPYANYKIFENKLINFFKGAQFLQLASNVDVEERTKQEEELKNLEIQINKLEDNNNNLLDTIQLTESKQVRDSILKRMEENNIKINKLKDKTNKIDIVDIKTEELNSNIDLNDIYIREKYNALLRKTLKHIKFYDGFVFVCLKSNPSEEAVFHLKAKVYKDYRCLKTEKDLGEFLSGTYSLMCLFRILTIMEQSQIDGLTWKQTNRILREEKLQALYKELGKKVWEGIKKQQDKMMGNYTLEDWENENLTEMRETIEEQI
jgi:DNA invertase Pin-like site-specific DNA recombinase